MAVMLYSGNWKGQKPFKKGSACTQCDSGKFYCTDQLCDCTYYKVLIKRGSMLGQRQLPPKPRHSPPKIDMKHCVTNSKRRHIGAKSRVLWPSKYAKIRFRPLRVSQRSPFSLVGWGGDTPPIPTAPQMFLFKTTPAYSMCASQFNNENTRFISIVRIGPTNIIT